MKYADGPTAEVDVVIDAPVERVWALISDINLPARFSPEFVGAEWLDDGPALGARFVGRDQHQALGQWETTSWVNRCQPGHEFGWAVSDPDHPSATWWFVIEPVPEDAGRVRLRQGARIGPARSGLSIARGVAARAIEIALALPRRAGETARASRRPGVHSTTPASRRLPIRRRRG